MLAEVLNSATALVDRLTTLDEWSVLLVTFGSTAVEMTFLLGLLVPGESVVMLAAALHGPGGFALAVVAATAGALAGQTLGYAVGRIFGARLRDTRLGRRIGTDRFDRAESYLRERGAPALVAVRFVAVIHAVVPIVAGVARMPFGRFLGWSALGTLLWVGAFAGVGAATASADSTGGIGVVLTAIGATCLGVVPFAARFLKRTALATSLKRAATRPGSLLRVATLLSLLLRTVTPRPGFLLRAATAGGPGPWGAWPLGTTLLTETVPLTGASRLPRQTALSGGEVRPLRQTTGPGGAARPLRRTAGPGGPVRPLRWTALLTGPARPARQTALLTGPARLPRRTARLPAPVPSSPGFQAQRCGGRAPRPGVASRSGRRLR